MGVKLAEVIAVLDAAYPPGLAHSWDSVGLVCGDPDGVVDSVTVAVDATAEVAATVGPRGLLLAHHPLLLRGVDTVAASTPKGALIHHLIRDDAALFTAHTNADSANPGVSDALAEVLGLTVDAVLDPATGQNADKWVILVPGADADAVRAAVFAAGATPSIGSVERAGEDRVEVVAPARLRAQVLAAIHASHPYEEPAFDVVPLAALPAGVGIGRVGTLAQPLRFADFVARVGAVLPQTTWGVRAAGDPDAPVARVAVCGGAGDSLLGAATTAGVDAYVTADLRHHPADEHRRASGVALVDVAHWASEYPWCGQAAALLRSHFGAALTVGVCDLRTDPWNIDVSRGTL
ncbi:Nif3-like dinuclear metal center hexameric protein [Mycolicibacterium helvum]|uniref:GTP cyclohydrolase 1 type 2 homolog n=1 Tax=Mycolicibacterium helvum TaxID=1534349 RepID=A0A7I7TGI5_9MYCO|nr:Nif3-like dinuclear metal center hexameric protein [Mycolicibacterium helvum]BBY67711.1 GTP cyclohydrolase 1 type 2 [Mycolicibacterium helvum]